MRPQSLLTSSFPWPTHCPNACNRTLPDFSLTFISFISPPILTAVIQLRFTWSQSSVRICHMMESGLLFYLPGTDVLLGTAALLCPAPPCLRGTGRYVDFCSQCSVAHCCIGQWPQPTVHSHLDWLLLTTSMKSYFDSFCLVADGVPSIWHNFFFFWGGEHTYLLPKPWTKIHIKRGYLHHFSSWWFFSEHITFLCT